MAFWTIVEIDQLNEWIWEGSADCKSWRSRLRRQHYKERDGSEEYWSRARATAQVHPLVKIFLTLKSLAAKHLEGAGLCRTAALKWKPRKKLRGSQSFRSVGNGSVTSLSDINEEWYQCAGVSVPRSCRRVTPRLNWTCSRIFTVYRKHDSRVRLLPEEKINRKKTR